VLGWIVFAIVLYELGSIHRHLHQIECATIGHITDRDGSVWRECK
jgi:hypothetical protein